MPHRDPRCVYVSPSATEADVVVNMLGHAGIAAQVMDRTTLGGFVGMTIWSSNGIASRGLEVWVIDEKDLSQARTILGEYEARQRIAAQEKLTLGPIDAVCEECGKSSTFSAAQRGTLQDCPHCAAYMDVPGDDDVEWSGRENPRGLAMQTYESQLNADPMWALREGSMHFEKDSAVHKAMVKIARRLDELQIPYAVAGGMGMFLHGYRRFTEDVDILVSAEGLRNIHEHLVGLGYVPVYAGSKNLRDAEQGVRVEFLVEGGFPGDGLPKAVAFPSPEDVSVRIGEVRCVSLEKLIELKLASGTAKGRRKDLGDVQEMIRALSLPIDLADKLDPSVRDLYCELHTELD